MNEAMPPTLGDAIATEPLWLQGWLTVLGVAHLLAILFVVTRTPNGWRVRIEPIAIIVSILVAGVLMDWIYAQVGYVRLLGVAHIIVWTPVYVWILIRWRALGNRTLFGKYLLLYLLVAGTSLFIDAIDVVRYLVGDGELLYRWGKPG